MKSLSLRNRAGRFQARIRLQHQSRPKAAHENCEVACIAHKPWKKEHSLFCLILSPLHTEPLSERLYSAKISRALSLVGFSG